MRKRARRAMTAAVEALGARAALGVPEADERALPKLPASVDFAFGPRVGEETQRRKDAKTQGFLCLVFFASLRLCVFAFNLRYFTDAGILAARSASILR